MEAPLMASKHDLPSPESDEGSAKKRARVEATTTLVQLNPADCDLDFYVDESGLQGHALHEGGFAYCWSGARAAIGITGGKYCFGCKIVSEQAVDMDDTPIDQQHVCRVGVSRGDDPVGNLGESLHSFGYGGTGKFSNAGKFSDYGSKFGVGDTIVCAVDLQTKPLATIGFSKNGNWLGVARHFNASSMSIGRVDMSQRKLTWEFALFPHVLLKNVVVQLQFSMEDGLIPEEGYKPWNHALGDGNAMVGPSFVSPNECEVFMMVGLPASGKTTWAEKWIKKHPEKRYVLLGTNLALDQMKVPGLHRKHNYGERFDRLMDRATNIFNTLLDRAAKTMRNYILDQTNVYKGARIRKLRAFRNHRKVAVVIFPTSNELKTRAEKRVKEMGKEVPAEAVNEMIANFVLPMTKNMPGSNELFDEVMFEELNREEAQRHLDSMKCALGSSNLNSNRSLPPFSREISIQSFSSKAPSAAGRQWHGSPSKVLREGHDHFITREVNTATYGQNSFGVPQTRSEDASLPLPTDGSYANHPKFVIDSVRRDESGPYGSFNIYSKNAYRSTLQPPNNAMPYQTYNRTNVMRPPSDVLPYQIHNSTDVLQPPNDMLPYQTHNSTDVPGRSSFGDHYSGGRSIYERPLTPPSYDYPGAQVPHSGYPPPFRQTPPPNSWRSPVQGTYGTVSCPPYSAPRPGPQEGNSYPRNPGPYPPYPYC